ncbi:MAG: hypothetical protein KF782_06520 [Labilithrix sp.]|nr:hypothetical protein [Labilithrix sp.]
MNRRRDPRRRSLLATLASLSIALAAPGCSDDRPGATGGGSVPPPSGGGARDGGAVTPGPDGGPAADLCDPAAIEVDGEDVAEIVVRAETPPDPLGGAIEPGTYVLTEVTRFAAGDDVRDDEDGGGGGGPAASDKLTRKSLVVAGDTYRFGERAGTVGGDVAATPALSGGTFEAGGTSVTLTDSCPTVVARTIGYTAVGATLSLYTTKDRRETYVRR